LPFSKYSRPCQKSPSTNTATFAEGKTKSGVPGKARQCSRYRKPSFQHAFRNATSGPVFSVLTEDIIPDRLSVVSHFLTMFTHPFSFFSYYAVFPSF
jgi:hypothetical protein